MEWLEYNQIINDLLIKVRLCRMKDHEIQSLVQEQIELIGCIEGTLKRLISDTDLEIANQPMSLGNAYAIADNKPLSKAEAEKLDQTNFDVVIDLPRHILKARKGPSGKSKLIECDLSGIGPRRLEIVAFMAARKGFCISRDEIAGFIPAIEDSKPNSFTKTICLIRKALGQKSDEGPYLITFHRKSRSGYAAYQFNVKWKYLVIKKIF